MSAHTEDRPVRTPQVEVKPVSFLRVLHAEWIKLWSLRSTYWTTFLTLGVMVLLAVLLGVSAIVAAEAEGEGVGPDGVMAIGIGYYFAQIVVAVLGVLSITGEYSTGMIRSTLAAVPRRLPALAAKAVVVAGVGFVLGVVGVTLSYLVSYPLFGSDHAASLSDPQVQRIFWGSGLYLAGIGVLGVGVGTILRHTAGAITLILGTLLLLPSLWQLLSMTSDWFVSSMAYLPSIAGERIASPELGEAGGGLESLSPWAGYGVFMIYVVLSLLLAGVLLRKRDA